MENKTYLRNILGDTEFRNLSPIQKCVCIMVVLSWLSKHQVRKQWSRWTCKTKRKIGF